MSEKTETLKGNVEDIPLEDNTIDLAISRCSLWFWKQETKRRNR